MAPAAVTRLRRRAVAGFLATAGLFAPASAAEPATIRLGTGEVDSDEEKGGVIPTAAVPAGTSVEAVPDVPEPKFVRPDRAAGLPDAVKPFASLKKATGRYTMLAGQGNDLGMDMIDGETLFAFRDAPNLVVGPSGGVIFLDGPVRTDLPAQLYTAQFDARWSGQIGRPFFYDLAFMPAIYTDGNNTGTDALRLQARAIGYLAFSEQTQIALGGTYLGRKDVPFLPIFGLLYAPSDDLKYELVFPRPRILKRVEQGEYGDTWAYLAGELGGGSWAVTRQDGRNDIASYRDYRLLIGLEQRNTPAWTANIEAGYVFGRQLQYQSGRGDYEPDNTFLLRLAMSH
jgi:hypothetical protein